MGGPRFQWLVLRGQGHQWLREGKGSSGASHLPALPTARDCVAGTGCWRQEVSLPGLSLWSMQSREVLQRTAWRFWGRTPLQVTLFSLYPWPPCIPAPASHCLTHPDGTTNGAALVMSTLILARCVSEWIKARHSLRFHTGPHTCWAITVTSPSFHRVTIILPWTIACINQYNG